MDRPEQWLVVIDMQHVFGDVGSNWHTTDFNAVVPVIKKLTGLFESRIVFTRFVPPTQPVGSWRDYYAQWPFALDAATPTTLWDVIPDFPTEDAAVVDASTMGKWNEELLIATGGSRHIVLCGVSTDCCVLSTALAASDAGAHVTVVADACAGSSRESHRRALEAMALYAPQIHVLDADELSRRVNN